MFGLRAIAVFFFFFQAEDGIRDHCVTGVQTCAFRSRPHNMTEAIGHAGGADVVMASYALTEIAPCALEELLPRIWALARRLLVIVEPGTVAGHRRILAWRETLLGRSAQLVAPCSHDLRCPLASGSRWCHFSARLPRSR